MWAIDTKKSNVDTFYVSMGVIKFVHVKLFCINKFKRGFQVYAILLLTIIGFLNKLRYAKPVYKIFTKFNDSENTRGWLVCELSQSINFFSSSFAIVEQLVLIYGAFTNPFTLQNNPLQFSLCLT